MKANTVNDIATVLRYLDNPAPDLLREKSDVLLIIASLGPQYVAKWRVRFAFAVQELNNLSQQKETLVIGRIHRTHGFIFGYTQEGWVIHPDNYLDAKEVAKRLPTDDERTRFYALSRSQKQRFIQAHF